MESAFSGALQETYQGTVPGIEESFPTEAAYNLIFLSAAAVSLASVAMALIVARRKVAPTMTAGDPHGAGTGGH